jgi:hypothetical protein
MFEILTERARTEGLAAKILEQQGVDLAALRLTRVVARVRLVAEPGRRGSRPGRSGSWR